MRIEALFNLFKPAAHLPIIADSNKVKTLYSYWRLRIFYSIYLGYVFYYFTRKNFSFIGPSLKEQLFFTNAQIGTMGTIWAIAYGASKFLSGILCDRSNPRYFMSFGLIITGILNIAFSLAPPNLIILNVIWALNGWFQGWGWPPCTKLLTSWYTRQERGSWWSVATTSHAVGGFLVGYVVAFCIKIWNWQAAMMVPGIISIFIGILLIERLRDVPQSLGLPPLEEESKEEGHDLPIKTLLSEQILNNKYLWILAASYCFIYIIRTAINDWGVLYLYTVFELDKSTAAQCVTWAEAGGFFGMLLAGFLSDRLFAGRRIPVSIVCAVLLALTLATLRFLTPTPFVLGMVFCILGFFVFGPQMLIGLAAAEWVNKKAASTANGFVGLFGYVGTALAGYPLGYLIDTFGWNMFGAVIVSCSIITMVILLPMWYVKSGTTPPPQASSSDMEPEIKLAR